VDLSDHRDRVEVPVCLVRRAQMVSLGHVVMSACKVFQAYKVLEDQQVQRVILEQLE